jgi:Basic tilted helix bundle domain
MRPGITLSGPASGGGGLLPWPIDYIERHLGTEALPKSELIGFLRSHADTEFLQRWRLVGADRNVKKSHNCSQLIAAYKASLYVPTGMRIIYFTEIKIASPLAYGLLNIAPLTWL